MSGDHLQLHSAVQGLQVTRQSKRYAAHHAAYLSPVDLRFQIDLKCRVAASSPAQSDSFLVELVVAGLELAGEDACAPSNLNLKSRSEIDGQ